MSITHKSTRFAVILWVIDACQGCFAPPDPQDFYSLRSQKKMKTESENRTVFHTVRLTPLEAAELVEHAAATGVSVSALLRARTLGQPLPRGAAPAVNMAAWRELAATAANLNQLVHHLNTAALSDQQADIGLVEVKKIVIDVAEKVKKVRLELIGAGQ